MRFSALKGKFLHTKIQFSIIFSALLLFLVRLNSLQLVVITITHSMLFFLLLLCAASFVLSFIFSLSLLMMVVAVVFVARVKVSTQRKPAVDVFERILHKTANLYFSCSRNIVTQFSFWSSSRSLQNVVHILGILFFFPFQCARNLHEFRNRLFGFSFSYSREVLTRRRNSNSLSCGQ